MECVTCKQMTEWYLKENPEKRGYVLCEPCYEKSKNYFVYLDLPYQPERSKREDFSISEYDFLMSKYLRGEISYKEMVKRCGALNTVETQ